MDYIDAKTIVRNCKPIWSYLYFNYAIDIYRGCNHGCIYCYARCNYYEKTGNFDNIRVKKNALEIIENELLHKRKTGVVITGGMSDPYNAYEKGLKLLRGALEIFLKHGFGACVITKSKLVARDFDLYIDIQKKAKDYGASYIYMGTEVTMSEGQREYFLDKAEQLYPGYAQKFLDRYGTYYHCRVAKAQKLRDIFYATCEQEKLQCSMETVNRQLWKKYYNPMTLFPDDM